MARAPAERGRDRRGARAGRRRDRRRSHRAAERQPRHRIPRERRPRPPAAASRSPSAARSWRRSRPIPKVACRGRYSSCAPRAESSACRSDASRTARSASSASTVPSTTTAASTRSRRTCSPSTAAATPTSAVRYPARRSWAASRPGSQRGMDGRAEVGQTCAGSARDLLRRAGPPRCQRHLPDEHRRWHPHDPGQPGYRRLHDRPADRPCCPPDRAWWFQWRLRLRATRSAANPARNASTWCGRDLPLRHHGLLDRRDPGGRKALSHPAATAAETVRDPDP